MSDLWKQRNDYKDPVLPDVNRLVYERKSHMSSIRIMGTHTGYYYVEMGGSKGFNLDSLPLNELKELTKALVKEIADREESL